MAIWCCACGKNVNAQLTTGAEIYPRIKGMANRPFWKCNTCANYVGTHYKTITPTRPLGNIPTPEIRNARSHIHAILDPIWKLKRRSRSSIYAELTRFIGKQYHTGEIKTLDEARIIYREVRRIACEADLPPK